VAVDKDEILPADFLALAFRASFKNYALAMFKQQFKRNFIINSHHERIFEVLQDVVDGKITRLIINMPPRYGKTEVVVKSFISWCYALNPMCKFIHLSYSDTLVQDNSRCIRDIMCDPLYGQLFPASSIKTTAKSTTKWETNAGGGFYAVSTQGQVTGFGAGVVDDEEINTAIDGLNDASQYPVFSGAIVIDDPIKPEDALSDIVRERINARFENTIRNRVNSRRTPIIINMQRLHEHDLCGYLKDLEGDEWTVLSLPALSTNDEGEEVALWPHKHTIAELRKIEKADPMVFCTQYLQDPTPLEGLMYSPFRTYETIPISKRRVKKNYTDTADTGTDYLCSICYTETEEACFVEDIVYTQKPMEYTETAVADMLNNHKTNETNIESNNGGRGFARSVERLLRVSGNAATRINWFTQTLNKNVRIFSNSSKVTNIIYMPIGWEKRWPEFYKAVTSYRKESKNSHDDAADTLTGIAEKFYKPPTTGGRWATS